MLARQFIHAPLERLAEPEIVAVERQDVLADDRAIAPIRQGDFEIKHPAIERLARDLGLFDQAENPRFFRSEEYTSELQSLMRISFAVFCLQNNLNKFTTSSPAARTTLPHFTAQCT